MEFFFKAFNLHMCVTLPNRSWLPRLAARIILTVYVEPYHCRNIICKKTYISQNLHEVIKLAKNIDGHGVSNYRQPHCLSTYLFRHTSKKMSQLCATDPLWRESIGHRWPIAREVFPCHDVIRAWKPWSIIDYVVRRRTAISREVSKQRDWML